MQFYSLCRKVQFNPIDFLADDDELFFITGRDECLSEITQHWVKKYFPQAKLVLTNHDFPDKSMDLDKWFVKQAKKKAKVINELNIDVYFEDTPQVVIELRKMCPNTKIIQYGGRAFG